MKHKKSFSTLNRTSSHRKALYKNMVEALLKKGRIKTTKVKAREIKKIVEKVLTRAKTKNLHNIRLISKMIKDKDLLKRLFDEIAPRYANRNGGYTRTIKFDRRKGDGAEMAFLELIEEQADTVKKKKKKKIKEADVKKDIEPKSDKDQISEVKETNETIGAVDAEADAKEEKKVDEKSE
jgi:large subunit ribosomal protein L17